VTRLRNDLGIVERGQIGFESEPQSDSVLSIRFSLTDEEHMFGAKLPSNMEPQPCVICKGQATTFGKYATCAKCSDKAIAHFLECQKKNFWKKMYVGNYFSSKLD